MAIRTVILNHMVSIAHPLLGSHIHRSYASVEQYITATRMDMEYTWGTEVEIYSPAHLLQTCIFTYDVQLSNWYRHSPHCVDRTLHDDITLMSMYINHSPQHFEVVHSVVK